MKHPIHNTQMSLFTSGQRKGSSEWSAFDGVRGDSVGMFQVRTPRKPDTPRYTNTVSIRRIRTSGIFPQRALN